MWRAGINLQVDYPNLYPSEHLWTEGYGLYVTSRINKKEKVHFLQAQIKTLLTKRLDLTWLLGWAEASISGVDVGISSGAVSRIELCFCGGWRAHSASLSVYDL